MKSQWAMNVARIQRYDITVGYERGKNMFQADLLSRAYLTKDAEPESQKFESVNMANYVPISDQRLEEITQKTQRDKSLQVLIKVILQDWPEGKSSVPALVSTSLQPARRVDSLKWYHLQS